MLTTITNPTTPIGTSPERERHANTVPKHLHPLDAHASQEPELPSGELQALQLLGSNIHAARITGTIKLDKKNKVLTIANTYHIRFAGARRYGDVFSLSEHMGALGIVTLYYDLFSWEVLDRLKILFDNYYDDNDTE